MTTNPLHAHSIYAMPPPPGDIHHIDLIEDDSIHMLSWDDELPESIVLHESSEVDGVFIGSSGFHTLQFDLRGGVVLVDSFYTFGYQMPGYFCPVDFVAK